MKSEVLDNRLVRNRFKRAGAWLLGFCWLGVVFASMVIAFSPSSYMPVMGWILLPTLRSPEWVLRDGVAVVHP
jgi:hypothetical protein